jgi:PAS domain S-box-containing protein
MPVTPEALASSLLDARLRLHAAVWPRSVLLSALIAAVLVVMAWPALSGPALLAWVLAQAAALGVRGAVGVAHRRVLSSAGAEAAARAPTAWMRRYRLSFALHGLVWAGVALMVPPALGESLQWPFVFALAAVSAGSLIATAYDLKAGLFFVVPAVTALVWTLVGPGSGLGLGAALMVLLFIGAAWLGAQRAQALVGDASAQRLALQASSEELRRSNAQTALAQQALADQHRLFEQLLQGTGEGFWFVDNEGKTTDLNPAMCRLLGRPRDQVVGRSVFEFFEGEGLETMAHQIALRQAGQPSSSYEVGIARPDGTRVYCVNQATAVYDAQGQKTGSVGIWTDITSRREAESTLRLYEQVTNSLTELVSVIGEDQVYRVVNDAWCRISRMSREEAVGMKASNLLTREDNLERALALETCIRTWQPVQLRGIVHFKRNTPRVIETTYAPFGADAAGVRCVVMVSRDVTEREESRAALEASAEYLRRTLGATGDAIFATDSDDHDLPVRFANEQMLAMWGIVLGPGQDLTSRMVTEHATPLFVDAEQELARIRQVVDSRQPDESRLQLRDGRTLLRRCIPASVAGRTLRVWSFRDITAEVQAMQALQRAEAEQRALLEAFPGYIGRLDTDLNYTYANRGLATIMGCTVQQLVGRSLLEVLGPERLAQVRPLARRALGGETVTYEQLHRVPHLGTQLHSQVTLAPGRDPRTGEPSIYGFAVDISALKQAEAALIAARDEAERANQAKSQFLSQMSHELRTPLNAILGFGQLIESDPAHPLALHQQSWVGEILRGAQHLLNLINEILDLGRIEAGGLALSPEPVPLQALADECLALVRPLALASEVELPAAADALAACAVQADRTRLKQVLLNLLGNAIKYNRQGGRVQLLARRDAREWWVGVRDSGPGIGQADLPRLFEPFERLSAAQGPVEGTGIGLALCRRLVQAMGGSIGVDSEPGRGSTFWFRLPEATPAQGVLTATAPLQLPVPGVPDAPAPRHTVLYIEDNPVNVALMQAMLARLPEVELVTAALPAEGLRLAQQLRPALVLLDIQLPGMDGFEVLARLRAQEATRALTVVAVSANALSSDIEAARAAGFAGYLTKPLSLDLLLDTVSQRLAVAPG